MKSKRAFFWICRKASGELPLIIIISLISMIESVGYIGLALVSRRAVNIAVKAASNGSDATDGLIKCAFLLIAVIAAQILLNALKTKLGTVLSGRLEINIRRSLFGTVLKKDYSKISSIHSGEIINRFTSDTDIVVNGVSGFLPQMVSIFAKVVAGLIVLASFSTGFVLIVIAVGMFVMLSALIFSPFYKRIHKDVQRSSGLVRSFVQECTENMAVVKSFPDRGPLKDRLDARLNDTYRLKQKRINVNNAAVSGLYFIFNAGYYATLCWGAFKIMGGDMDYGTLTAFLEIVSQLRAPFFNASGLLSSFYSALASAERIIELEELPDEPGADGFDLEKTYSDMEYLDFSGISFGYSDAKSIIKPSSFKIRKGSTVSITGPSGSGKSTLFKLLLGLYSPTAGSMTVKGTDLETPVGAATRPMFAYVPQGNLVLSGTIADNISFVSGKTDRDEIRKAAEVACIDDFIDTLPDGYDTVIGERGSGLSEGQIQRIAIARALMSEAPILLLDECTSALDEKTESALLENISALKTKTVLFISHRNKTLSICDTHIVLDNGTFSETDICGSI